MTNPSVGPVGREITVCPELRDRIFEHLPSQVRRSFIAVEVKFWPNNHGEMELTLKYEPDDRILDIEAQEGIYGPHDRLTGHIVKGCELDPETAEIRDYSENIVVMGDVEAADDSFVQAEKEAKRFDADKLGFFMRLFESL